MSSIRHNIHKTHPSHSLKANIIHHPLFFSKSGAQRSWCRHWRSACQVKTIVNHIDIRFEYPQSYHVSDLNISNHVMSNIGIKSNEQCVRFENLRSYHQSKIKSISYSCHQNLRSGIVMWQLVSIILWKAWMIFHQERFNFIRNTHRSSWVVNLINILFLLQFWCSQK